MGLLADRFRAQMAKSKDPRMEEAVSDVMYPTGFLPFDFLNGYRVHVKSDSQDFWYNSVGIVDGSSTTIIGRSGSGKTTIALQMAANIVRPFPEATIFYDDIEGGSNDTRREMLTHFSPEECQQRIIYRNTAVSAENFYKRIASIYDIKLNNRADFEYDTGKYDSYGNRIYKLIPTVYILDSLAMLTPEKLTEEEELSGQMSTTATAKTNTAVFKRIVPKLKAANIGLYTARIVSAVKKANIPICFTNSNANVRISSGDIPQAVPTIVTVAITNILASNATYATYDTSYEALIIAAPISTIALESALLPLGSIYITGLAFAYKYLCKLTGSLIFPAYESIEINVPVPGFIYLALR